MKGGSQKDVVLILARELASNIATPMLILDHNGTLIFFNEAAEIVLGARYNQVGEIAADVWDERWPTTERDGTPISLLTGPLARVILERTPGQQDLRVRSLDGSWRLIHATVYPLFASKERFVGAVGVFWQLDNGHGPDGTKTPAHSDATTGAPAEEASS